MKVEGKSKDYIAIKKTEQTKTNIGKRAECLCKINDGEAPGWLSRLRG